MISAQPSAKRGSLLRAVGHFAWDGAREISHGNRAYVSWVVFLLALVVWGGFAYATQLREGLAVTNLRDPACWGLYIGNFMFLDGLAAAAITLVIPAYFYDWGPLKQIVIFGELLAISALLMCMLFVSVDLGHPERAWHLLPIVGRLHFPDSLLAWDILALNAYLLVNVTIVSYLLYCSFYRIQYNRTFAHSLAFLSVPLALGILAVTAFLFSGLGARPAWHTAILGPMFIAGAFCAGLAVLTILFQLLDRTTRLRIPERALKRMAEVLAWSLTLYLFMLGGEYFTEYYVGTEHASHLIYLYQGLDGRHAMVPFTLGALAAELIALVLLIIPKTRRSLLTLNLACALVFAGLYVQKGMTLVVSGFVPSPLGEIHEYVPTLLELRVAAGIFGIGLLVFTFLCKIAVSIELGRVTHTLPPAEQANLPHWLLTRLLGEPVLLSRESSLVIGSADEADVQLRSERISSEHAQIRWDGRCFVIEDLSSTNGTLVNENAVSIPCPLFAGDRLDLGGHEIQVMVLPEGQHPKPPPSRTQRIQRPRKKEPEPR